MIIKTCVVEILSDYRIRLHRAPERQIISLTAGFQNKIHQPVSFAEKEADKLVR
jgi:hypothetical protein